MCSLNRFWEFGLTQLLLKQYMKSPKLKNIVFRPIRYNEKNSIIEIYTNFKLKNMDQPIIQQLFVNVNKFSVKITNLS